MSQLAFQRYFAVICLLMVGLGRIVLPGGGVVVCQDQNGGRIEFGCEKTVDGSCVISCDDGQAEDDRHIPSPCQDDPIESDPAIAKAPHRVGDLPELAVWVAIPALIMEVDAHRPVIASSRPCTSDPRPPDDVVRLRTVVLLV